MSKRPFSCWCKACSRVRERGVGSQSSRSDLLVGDCTRTKQTYWTEDQFTVVTVSAWIRNREKRVAKIVVRKIKGPNLAHGETYRLPKQTRKWEEYRGTRYYDGDSALVVELWLHRVADDLSGLTFQERDPSVGTRERY
jgi:hypothetical protein